MRFKDISDYYKLRKICKNPYQVLNFRKVRDSNSQLTVKFKDGHKIFIQGGTDQYHTFHRIYLRDEYRVNQCGPERMKCVIDLGGNVGFFSTRMSTVAKKVICCEPIKSNLDFLKLNRNGRKNIEVVEKAVAGEKCFINMFKPNTENWSARYSMVFNVNSKDENEVESVECTTLDELFEEHQIKTCDLIKMDIEGAEYETLYNASDHVLDKIDRIVGEYHHLEKDNDSHNIQALKKYLGQKGYRVEVVPHRRIDYIGWFFCQKK
jgi:FkbM family methyltransferase